MKVTETFEGWRMSLLVETDEGNEEVSFKEGEPEDNSFGRDLNDAFTIRRLVELAYNAGKNGEDIEWVDIDDSEEGEEI